MKYRHELKQIISPAEAVMLRRRLDAVMQRDGHSVNGSYTISSLYFDNMCDKALKEKLSGVSCREKFRLRCYNGDTEHIWLEKKSKINALCLKQRCEISRSTAQEIIGSGAMWHPDEPDGLLAELAAKMAVFGLRAKTVVDYEREAFVYPAGNVRVTLDGGIRMSLRPDDFLNNDRLVIPARQEGIILEVKWDEFLPDVIRGVVQPGSARTESFSKYAACRVYG